VDDVTEVSRASRGSQAQPCEDEEEAKNAEENSMHIATIAVSMYITLKIAG
jgi:hypothetical protein